MSDGAERSAPAGHYYYKEDPNVGNRDIKIYRVLGAALPAGHLKNDVKNLVVYQRINGKVGAGQIFVRELNEFHEKMLPFPPKNWNPFISTSTES